MGTWNLGRVGRAAKLVLVNSVGMAYCIPNSIRLALLRFAGFEIGRVAVLAHSIVRCTSLRIGDGSYVNHGCLFDRGDIDIGTNVYISSGVTFATGGHEQGSSNKRAGQDYSRPIVVGDGCWIGANVVVLSGVSIGPGCIIGAGAVVTKSVERDGLYAGLPARRIRDLS